MKISKSLVLIGLGVVNILHALLHLFQFLQSVLLFANSVSGGDGHSPIEEFMHSPYMALVWAFVGILTLYIGIKDYKHHRKCKTEKSD